MRKELEIGTNITLKEICSNNEHGFKIIDVIGAGASCIVYTAVHIDNEGNEIPCRLKECYPEGLDITRNDDLSLCISERYSDKFHSQLDRFTKGYRKLLELRKSPASMNSISSVQEIYEGNGTKYVSMNCQNSITIDEAGDMSLYDIFRYIKAIALQIKAFHDSGYLYLDLKPANVLLYPETPELMMLFDFDSAVKISEIDSLNISYTQKWAAPEIVQRKIKNISFKSDIYTIGALLMYMIFKRSPELSDRSRNAKWDDEFANSILADESPEIKRMIIEIFRKTLAADTEKRYDNCDELLEIIEPYIQSFQQQKPYLKTVLPMSNNYFCGRDREISEIHEILQNRTNFLILHGIGGIGKSELAKHYAEKYSKNYDAVIFVRYDSSIIETVSSDSRFPVVNCKRSDDESDEDYFNRKISILQKICTPRHLIILDNFDTDECDNLDELTSLDCKFLITSRVDFEDIFPQYEVNILDDFDSLRDIFGYYSRLENDEYSDNIIIALEGHTMAVELVSRQMKLNDISASEMYEKLCENGISADENKVKNLKDGSLRNKTALVHMEILFNVFNTSEEIRNVLCHAAMIGEISISKEQLISLCEFDSDEVQILEKTIRGGWVSEYDSVIQIHSLIDEVLLSQLDPDIERYWRFQKNVTEIAETLDNLSADERRQTEQIMLHISRHIHGEPAIVIYFLKTLAEIHEQRHEFAEAEKSILKYMEISKEYYQDEAPNYKYEYLWLADLARQQGKSDREKYYMEIADKLLDDSDIISEEQLKSYMDMDYESTIEHGKKLLEIAVSNDEFYNAYSILALAEETLSGDVDKMIAYGRDELKYAELILDEKSSAEPLEIVSSIEDIAIAYLHCCEYDEAVSVIKSAEKNLKENSLDNTVDAITTYLILGRCYAFADKKKKMLSVMNKGIGIIENHFDESHPKRTEYYKLYCNVYNVAFQIHEDNVFIFEQIKLTEKMIQVFENMDSAEELASTELNLSNLFFIVDNEEKCIEHINKSLSYYDEIYDEDDPEWIIPLMCIWQNLLCLGYADYEEIYNRTIEICELNGLYEEAEENRNLLNELLDEEEE